MQAYYSDHFVLPLPPGHRFPMGKYAMLRDHLRLHQPGIRLFETPAATDGELALVHTPTYVDAVTLGRLSAAEQREIGFPWTPRMVERARRSVGGTIAAARTALAQGVSGQLAGGTHHAYAGKGSGYCVFNDIAVAARLMQAEWHRRHRSLLRVVVIDLDVHQGNGTASVFQDDPTVFTLSMHGQKNFPFRKERSDIDVDLPDGCQDDAYLAALDEALQATWQRHADEPPGLAFYLAGADPHDNDRLGRLKISTEGLAERDRRVFAALHERRIPVAFSMGGGYGRTMESTVAVQANTFDQAMRSWRAWGTGRAPFSVEQSRA